MLRRLSVALCHLLLRIFFRRIELVGSENIPSDGLIVFVLNHPSGLIDPLFVLCLTNQRVSFLAKEPLFRMPVVGTFVRAFECLPVYRSRDGADPQQNRQMLEAARRLLLAGNALALFPEGTSHSDPHLKPLRTGAARLALSTRARSTRPVYLIPGGLFYEQKQRFRSRALLTFGNAIPVPVVDLDEYHEPHPERSRALTQHIQHAIEAVLPTTETLDGLSLSETAERLFSAAVQDTPHLCPSATRWIGLTQTPSLGERVRRRTLFISAYQNLVQSRSSKVEALIHQVLQLDAEFSQAKMPVDTLDLSPRGSWVSRKLIPWLVMSLLLAPALLGLMIYSPAYFAVRWIALKYSAQEADITATVKVLAGSLLFPASWLMLVALFASVSWTAAGLAGTIAMLAAVSTVMLRDRLGAQLYRAHRDTKSLTAQQEWIRLRDARGQLAEEMGALLEENAQAQT